jgi:hypothetical protein
VAQFALGAAAIVDQQRSFVRRQLIGHFVELAVRYADGHGNMALVVFGPLGSGIDDHDVVCHGHFGVLLDKGHLHDVVEAPILGCRFAGVVCRR